MLAHASFIVCTGGYGNVIFPILPIAMGSKRGTDRLEST